MKKLAFIILLVPFISVGQQPLINSITPTHVEVGQAVTISGVGWSGTLK